MNKEEFDVQTKKLGIEDTVSLVDFQDIKRVYYEFNEDFSKETMAKIYWLDKPLYTKMLSVYYVRQQIDKEISKKISCGKFN